MARISVVVPVFDVEPYLEECLRSIAAQTVEDLEVVMVDDGSTDGSPAIARRFAEDDRRFQLLRQPNRGLAAARNTGIEATAGDYLAFVDSDDVLPRDAYERLLRSLEATGSDFATGNVHRLSSAGLAQAPFVAKAFARTRLRTHVRRFSPLLADRTAWNKLWRRSFWDGCELRFPEGRLHEDIPVVLPAHFRARTVDVIAGSIYHYRVREGGAPSITQRRHELRALQDRFTAVEEVCAFLERHEPGRQLRRYRRSALAGDLRYHLDLLEEADDAYRDAFMARARTFLERSGRHACDPLPAIDRCKWHLVREGRLPELVELLRFQREEALQTPPERRLGRYRAAYPPGAAAAVPRSCLRLGRRDRELAATATLEDLRLEDGKLRLAGHAHVNALGADQPYSQRLTLGAVRPGRARAVRMRIAPHAIPTAPERRPDLDRARSWAGFRAALELGDLRGEGEWELYAEVRRGLLRRRRARFAVADTVPIGTVEAPRADGKLAAARVTPDGRATVRIAARWARIERHAVAGGKLRLEGAARLAGDAAALELVRGGRRESAAFPLALADDRFAVEIPLAGVTPPDAFADWDLHLEGVPLLLEQGLAGAAWRAGGVDMWLARTAAGGARLHVRALAPAAGSLAQGDSAGGRSSSASSSNLSWRTSGWPPSRASSITRLSQ